MGFPKRKRAASVSSVDSENDDSYEIDCANSDDDMDMDISTALTGRATKNAPRRQEAEEDDEELASFIKSSIAKRDIKQGTEVVKKAKGKAKVAKGETGGGSFQSMGAFSGILLLVPLV